jgi:hypothetical protein
VTHIHPRLEIGEIIHASEVLFQIDDRNYMAAVKELKAIVLEMRTRFAEMNKRMDERFAEMNKRMDERFAAMNKIMDERFESMNKIMDDRFAAMNKQWMIALLP